MRQRPVDHILLQPLILELIFLEVINSSPSNSGDWYHCVQVCRAFRNAGYRKCIHNKVRKRLISVKRGVTPVRSGNSNDLNDGTYAGRYAFSVMHTRWRSHDMTYVVGERTEDCKRVYTMDCNVPQKRYLSNYPFVEGKLSTQVVVVENIYGNCEVEYAPNQILVHSERNGDFLFYLAPETESLMFTELY